MGIVLDAATRAEFNKVKLKLWEAGVQLDGQFKWQLVEVYWNPVGFDFTCDDPKRLQQVADRSKKLVVDSIDMPGYDPWRKAGILSVGFSPRTAPPRVHLDIAIQQPGVSHAYPGLCRVYITPVSAAPKRDASVFNSDVFRKIQARLGDFNPAVPIDKHVVDDPTVLQRLAAEKIEPLVAQRNTLGGIDFVVKNREDLLIALAIAKKGTEKAFEKGGTKPEDWREHWALAMSFMATNGIGFREPWRLFLNDRDLRIADAQPPLQDKPEMDGRFSANFGNDIKLDFSALHVAIAEFGSLRSPRTMCNIHVDETGIAMASLDDKVTITPSAAPHLANELLLKTKLEGKLPAWFIDRFNLNIFSPGQEYSKVGASFDLAKGTQYKWTISGSWGLTSHGRFEWSGTTNLSFSHDFLSGSKKKK